MKLTISKRIAEGKKVKNMRKEWLVPCIIYGRHLESPLAVACNKNEFIKLFKQSWYSTPLTLEGDGIDQMVLVQDIQTDPVSSYVLHIDFLAVNKNEKVTTEVAVVVVGESSVDKLGLGRVQLIKDVVTVEALPQDLPKEITVDISGITTPNDVIFIKDLVVPKGVEIQEDGEQPIVTVLDLQEEVAETPAPAAEAPAADAKKDDKAEKKEEKK